MATTRIISMHRNKGKTIAQCLKDRTDYAKNPDKTNQGELISSYECDIRSVDAEFMLAKREYLAITGRRQKNDVIAYQVRQSFKPGEITAEDANRIGYELAMRFLKGQHAFIVATHNDKKHIHNHIIWNSTSLDCSRKFRDFLGSGKAVARLSDLICLKHQLSVVPEPKGHGQSYNKWLGNEKSPSHRELLRRVIDNSMAQNPDNLDALLTLLQAEGWEIKRGKQISLRGPGQSRYIRLKSLGDGYDEDSLRKALSTRTKNNTFSKKQDRNIPHGQFNMLIDIQAKLQSGKGGGYERWAKVFNLKQMAQTLNYLSENKLSNFDSLAEKTSAATKRHHEVLDEIKAIEKRMTEISQLRTHVRNYLKTKDTYVAYRKAGYSKRFATEHQDEIQLHKAAKKAFDNLGAKQIPSIRALQEEYAELVEKKKALYPEYRKLRDEMRALLTAKANVERIMNLDKEEPINEQKKEQSK